MNIFKISGYINTYPKYNLYNPIACICILRSQIQSTPHLTPGGRSPPDALLLQPILNFSHNDGV